jgi:predicted ATPase
MIRQRQRFSSAWDLEVHGTLFDRNQEREQLEQVYARSKDASTRTTNIASMSATTTTTTQVVLIHGKTGVGKTALAESLRPRVHSDGGYFVKAKYDQVLPRQEESYSTLISAFDTLAKDVLDRGDGEIQRVRASVKELLGGDERDLLKALIPTLKLIFPVDSRDNKDDDDSERAAPCTLYQTSEAGNLFKHAFRLFLRALCSPEHPLICFLDDLHWADEMALDLLSSLVQDDGIHGCFFIGTYRDDGSDTSNPSHCHQLNGMLSQINNNDCTNDDVRLTRIGIHELNAVAVCHMLSEVFRFNGDTAGELAKLVFSQTRGNMFFMLEYLRALNEAGLLWYDSSDKEWVYELGRSALTFDSVGDLILSVIKALPDRAQETLRVAACLGSRIDEDILGRLSTHEVVAADLALIAGKGLINCNSRGVWAFAHDGITETIHNLMSETEKSKLHYRIGRELWSVLDVEEIDEFVFVVLGQLVSGAAQVTKEKERVAIATLCLRAAERAVTLSCFHMAFSFLTHGTSLLGPRRWRDEYQLCLSLHSAAAEVAYCTMHFEDVDRLVDDVIANARCYMDTLRVQTTRIYKIGSRGQAAEALACGLDVLQTLGVFLPLNPSKVDAFLALRRIKKRLKRTPNESILRLPRMEDPEKLCAIQLIGMLGTYAFVPKPNLLVLLTEQAIVLTLDYGLSAASSVGFVFYGVLLTWCVLEPIASVILTFPSCANSVLVQASKV